MALNLLVAKLYIIVHVLGSIVMLHNILCNILSRRQHSVNNVTSDTVSMYEDLGIALFIVTYGFIMSC